MCVCACVAADAGSVSPKWVQAGRGGEGVGVAQVVGSAKAYPYMDFMHRASSFSIKVNIGSWRKRLQLLGYSKWYAIVLL